MKNLHLLPTDKPSRFTLRKDSNYFRFRKDEFVNNDTYQNLHIYITSDGEIKEGDWLFANQGVNKIVEIKEGNYPYGSINNKGDKIFNSKHWKSKIILTTDQDLIKDGVQPIDDEFLEWFVKNPSCEYVEVELLQAYKLDGELGGFMYKTVFPQEEPKQEVPEKTKGLVYWKANAEEDYVKVPISVLRYIAELEAKMYSEAIEFANWQAKRRYSEEEMYLLVIEYQEYLKRTFHPEFSQATFKEWFEQFKKNQDEK
jgi:hypothetical protein